MGDEIVSSIKSGSKFYYVEMEDQQLTHNTLQLKCSKIKPQNNRAAIPAIALAQDTSTITACGNDFGYNFLFERMLQGLGNTGDILIALSTSGNSENVLRAIKKAKTLKLKFLDFWDIKEVKQKIL